MRCFCGTVFNKAGLTQLGECQTEDNFIMQSGSRVFDPPKPQIFWHFFFPSFFFNEQRKSTHQDRRQLIVVIFYLC